MANPPVWASVGEPLALSFIFKVTARPYNPPETPPLPLYSSKTSTEYREGETSQQSIKPSPSLHWTISLLSVFLSLTLSHSHTPTVLHTRTVSHCITQIFFTMLQCHTMLSKFISSRKKSKELEIIVPLYFSQIQYWE